MRRILAHSFRLSISLFIVGIPLLLAFASIPQSQTIAARLARGHGKNVYVIEQDIQFRTSAEPLVLRERWLIENGERMRLTVTTPTVSGIKANDSASFEALYRDGKRTYTELNAGVKTSAISQEFAEGFFHMRSGKSFLTALIKSRVVPGDFFREKSKPTKIEQIHHIPDPYVRLGRDNGIVAWIFGEPSPVEGKLSPQVWIEQDSFILKRLRFPSEAEIIADRYSSYPNGLKFPRERTINWSDNTVTIRVVSVRSMTSVQAGRSFEVATFSNGAKPGRLPELPQVREFYSRFR
jgi:hypothetical protein